MGTSAVIMLLIGAVGLWGTLTFAVWNFLRRSAAESKDGTGQP
ncbi:hypothetical protein [Actinoplanes auranticolor]|uniref:Uncharacterized protein n=1 Tax=Actinoplanes auranticolor TaxID=47988 RepID=A0A919SHP1_9ACTN|nr:hypothetical protein [Actinoplanes auranticolor]GIM71864.1 hypothetical protein Aau02nite_48100 [Actinoplanes auranticolor]